MNIMDKLKILTFAAKYDVACTSSGVDRGAKRGSLGNTEACGICHSFSADGRCISLLKVLLTNYCIYDCQYCVNRRSNDVQRTAFTPREIAELTINFYKRNYIEGLFLSSAIIKSPDHTMELLYQVLNIVRNEYHFSGYIHVKAIPGADPGLIQLTGQLADRMSVNIELPSSQSLNMLAPEKLKQDIFTPMKMLKNNIEQSKYELQVYKHSEKFVPAGQSTQMIIGASPDNDRQIMTLAEGLYDKYRLKRVFYSAYNPVGAPGLPTANPPMLREHRLYQADWLLRFYGFKADDLLNDQCENLSLNMDPKCQWAINNIRLFPVEVNKADAAMLLKVPGIGQRSVDKIVKARRAGTLKFENLKKMGIVLKRAKYFITCEGKMMDKFSLYPEILEMKLSENKISESCEQISLFDSSTNNIPLLLDRQVQPGLVGVSGTPNHVQQMLITDSRNNEVPFDNRFYTTELQNNYQPFSEPAAPSGEDVVKCLTGEI